MLSEKTFQNYKKSVNFIESLINLSETQSRLTLPLEEKLKGLKKLLDSLSNPEKKFKIIHIAGTSGKGSTCALIQNILAKAGYKTGLYVSPHPTTTIERIKINNKFISPENFYKTAEKLKPFWQEMMNQGFSCLSYFDALLSIALVYFAEEKCDFVVLETGMGGLYDSTNVIPAPLVSAITNINFDHTEFLGNTLKKICVEKAGIIKPKSIFFTTEKRTHLVKIIKNKCAKTGASFSKLNFKNSKEKKYFQKLNLVYNPYNILLAYNIGKSLNIKEEIIKKGIKTLPQMSCRYETMQENPKVIIDGGHNPSKIKFLAEQISKEQFKKLYLICGFAKNKDVFESLKYLFPHCSEVLATRYLMPLRKAFSPKDIADFAFQNKKESRIFLDPDDALDYALKKAKKDDLILITGSFYLCGMLRTNWISEEKILKARKSI